MGNGYVSTISNRNSIFLLCDWVRWNSKKYPELKSAGIWALSYTSLTVGFIGEAAYSVTKKFDFLTPVTDTLLILGAMLLSVGLIKFYERKLPTLALGSIFLSTISVTLWFWFVEDNPSIRTELGGYGIAGLLGIGAWSASKHTKTTIHNLIFITTTAFSCFLSAAVFIGFHAIPQLMAIQSVNLSMVVEVLHLGSGLLAFSIGILFFLASVMKISADLTHKTETDTLTNLNNQRAFEEKAKEAIKEAHFSKSSLALIVCNIDHFNRINEKLGRSEGDLILKAFGQKLAGLCRPIDFVGRINDDNFAVLLQVATSNMARLVAECARTGIRETISNDKITKPITASFGVAELQVGETYYDLCQRAGNCLLNAKDSGRNQVIDCLSGVSYEDLDDNRKTDPFTENLNSIENWKRFAKSLERRSQSKCEIEREIDGALKRNEFHLVLQPVFDLKTNSIIGCETLLRWDSPKLENVGPAEFIPILEANGDIIPIGKWILEQACLQAASWYSPMIIAVNVSTRQLLEADFVVSVLEILSRTGLSPAWLELELTESILIRDAKGAAKVIDELRSHGISIALDDFGTGFSSMSYLRDFRFDKIKIDRSFISALSENNTTGSNALIHAIVNMAKTMNMKVTAEGIETPEQAKFLQSIECEFGQGYHFARPMGIDAFAAKTGVAFQRIAS